MEIAVKDGIRYLPHQYKNEIELENLVNLFFLIKRRYYE